MNRDIHITIKNADNLAFGLTVGCLIIVWFAFIAFAPGTKHTPETQAYLDGQIAMPSNGMEY